MWKSVTHNPPNNDTSGRNAANSGHWSFNPCMIFSFFCYLYIALSIYLSIYLSISLSLYLSIYLPIYLSIYPSVCVSVCPPVCLHVCLPVCLNKSSLTPVLIHLSSCGCQYPAYWTRMIPQARETRYLHTSFPVSRNCSTTVASYMVTAGQPFGAQDWHIQCQLGTSWLIFKCI